MGRRRSDAVARLQRANQNVMTIMATTPAPFATLAAGKAATNVIVLDTVVFLLGVALLGAVTWYWARRIFLEK